jgi:copper chaperone NosL
MGVVSQNYHSQVLTKKGRRYHFDSIECMFSFWNSNIDKIDKVWVKDYLHPKDWIEVQNAKFLRADKLSSPMAANLSSYKSEKEAEDNRVLYGGVLMTQEQVMEYVKTNWEKELSGK